MNKKVITIISGGPKPESEISCLCANDIKAALDKSKYEIREIVIDEKEQWKHGYYIKTPKRALEGSDVVINALFGKFGESGRVQNLLDKLGYPHTSSKGFASALAADKLASRGIFAQARFHVPQSYGVEYRKITDFRAVERDILGRFTLPFLIKPNSHTSSMGVTLIKQIGDIQPAIREAAKFDRVILIEQYLRGVEVVCGVVETKSGLIGLPPLTVTTHGEILRIKNEFNNSIAKNITSPAVSEEMVKQLKALAVFAHRLLGLRYYSRVDCMVVRDTIFILNVHSLPGLSRHSLMTRALGEWGLDFKSFLDHIVDLALLEKSDTFQRAYNRVNIV